MSEIDTTNDLRNVVCRLLDLFGAPDERLMQHASITRATLQRYAKDAGVRLDRLSATASPDACEHGDDCEYHRTLGAQLAMAQEAISDLAAERDQYRDSLQRIAAGETPESGAAQLAYDTLDGATPGPDTLAAVAFERDEARADAREMRHLNCWQANRIAGLRTVAAEMLEHIASDDDYADPAKVAAWRECAEHDFGPAAASALDVAGREADDADAANLRGVLKDHFLMQVVCDPGTKQDNPVCQCSRVHLGWHPSIGQAVDAWVDHVLGVLAPAGSGPDAAACPRGVPGCDGRDCGWQCPDCGCQNRHEVFCYLCGAGDPRAVAVASPDDDGSCCDLHGRNCEPPSGLCCEKCTEARHAGWTDGRGVKRFGHPAGETCSNPDLSGTGLDAAATRDGA